MANQEQTEPDQSVTRNLKTADMFTVCLTDACSFSDTPMLLFKQTFIKYQKLKSSNIKIMIQLIILKKYFFRD